MCSTYSNCYGGCGSYYSGCGSTYAGCGSTSSGCGSTTSSCCDDCTAAATPTTMTARVMEVSCNSLLVCDQSTCQQVQVNTSNACCYRAGQCLCIHYDGAMTASIPPQISATSICRIC